MRIHHLILLLIAIALARIPASAQFADTACVGDLNAGYRVIPTAGSTYQWWVDGGVVSNGQGQAAIRVDWGLVPGVYTVKVLETTAGLCKGDTVKASVLLSPIPVVQVSGLDTICSGDGVLLMASGAQTYYWNSIQGSENLYLLPQSDTLITLTGTINGCLSQPLVKRVKVIPRPKASFSVNPEVWIILDELVFTYTGDPGRNLRWYINDKLVKSGTEPELRYKATKKGSLSMALWVQGDYNCNDSVYLEGEVYEGWTVFLPTAFSPNNDGLNDEFGAKYFGYSKGRVLIRNAWGNIVFESDSLDFRWDGYTNGIAQPADNYTYELTVYDRLNKPRSFTGKFSLIR